MQKAFTIAISLGLFTGCLAGAQGNVGSPVSVFPSRSELEAVARTPAQAKAPLDVALADEWALEARSAQAEYPSETPWDQQVVQAISKSGGRLRAAPELRYAGNETARFYVTHNGYPSDGLRDYIVARCGSGLPDAQVQSIHWEVPAKVDEKQLQAELEKGLASLLGTLEKASGALGVGFARGEKRALFVAYYGEPKVALDAWSPLVTGDSFEVSGRFLGEAALALGLITHGRFGVSACEPDRSVDMPRFRLRCAMAPGDAQARLELATRKSNEVLMQPVLRLLPRRQEQDGMVYAPNLAATSAEAGAVQAFRDELLASLNRLRSEARLGPLTLESRQSAFNERLTGHFFEASVAGNGERTSQIALGLLAGWEVSGGMIANGGIFSRAQGGSQRAERWLAEALESPLGRWTLLDPQMSHIAIGASAIEPSGVMAVVTGYSFFGSFDHSAEEAAVFEELTKYRKARGLGPVERGERSPAMTNALARIASGEASSAGALRQVLNERSIGSFSPLTGWLMETSDVQRLPLADFPMQAQAIEVEVGVTHYKPEGAAWGQYAVLFVVKETQGAQRAAADREPSAPALDTAQAGL